MFVVGLYLRRRRLYLNFAHGVLFSLALSFSCVLRLFLMIIIAFYVGVNLEMHISITNRASSAPEAVRSRLAPD